VRPTLNTVCVLHFHQPTGVHPNAIERAFDQYYEVLLDQLDGSPNVRLNLHFTGTLLEHALARRPAFVDRLRRLWKEDRIEILGGAFHDPALPSIPDRDALGQLQYTSNFFARNLGRTPLGAWLCLRSWDPARIRTLALTGIRYTLLDDAQFVISGLHPDEIHGWYSTERSGHALAVFPIDAQFVGAVQRSDRDGLVETMDALARNAGERAWPEVFAGDGEALMRNGQLFQLLAVLRDEHHWVKTLTLEQAWSNFPGRGRLYLPTSCQPELGDWCRPAAAVARRRTWAREMALMGVWEQAQQFGGGVVWDNFLVKYPEANRLHKRMLRVSRRIDELRSALARNHKAGKNVDTVRKVLEKACSALWRSQNHSVYWHGGALNPGIYDPVLRQRTLRELLAAERVVDRVLDGKSPAPWQVTVADHDADGRDEALVRTPHFSAILDPGRGGGFWELDLRKRNIALHSSLSPVEEPYHQRTVGNEVSLVLDEDDEPDTLPPVDAGATAEPALAQLVVDRVPPGAFQDHFLGPETTLESFARRQFRELGDFADGAYEIVKNLEPNGGDFGSIVLGRSGVVKDVERTLLLRIEKTFQFSVSRPRLQVERELENRSRDPASVWYGLEWTFGVPSTRLDKVTMRTLGASADDDQVAWTLDDGPVDLGEHAWFEWEDAGSELAIVVEMDRPIRLWWAPVKTVCMGTDRFHEIAQGNTLLMHAPLEVWGTEKQSLQLRIDFIQT